MKKSITKIVAILLISICISKTFAQVRPNINSFSAGDQLILVNAMMAYIDVSVIEKHCQYNIVSGTVPPQIHSDFDFLPFHRNYIQGMEDYLVSQGLTQFVPLPKWDPAGCAPLVFQTAGPNNNGIDPDCSAAVCTNGNGACGSIQNWCPGGPVPTYLSLPIQPGALNDICDWNLNPAVPPLVAGTGPTGVDCCPTGLSRVIEGDLPNSAGSQYHNMLHVIMGGVMGNFRSPSVPTFWLWHAWVDDLWKSWEQNCPQSTTDPVDLWMADNNKLITSDRDRGEEPSIDLGPPYNSGDIWVRNQPDGFANQVHQTPVALPATPVFVYVRVRNRGFSSSLGSEQIELRWAKASTALDWPSRWNGSIDLDPGPIMAIAGDIINAQPISVITAGDQQIFEFAWFPPNPSDYNLINPEPGHFCLLARIVAANDPMTFTEITYLPSNVTNNNNIVWKNLTIIDNIPGLANDGTCPKVPLKRIGKSVVVANTNIVPTVFDITFSVPLEDFLHCPEEECVHLPDTAKHLVFGVPSTYPDDVVIHEPSKPITKEGRVIVAFDNELYQKWVQGGKKGTGFTEISTPGNSQSGNHFDPLAAPDRNVFEITAISAKFQNITLQPNEARATSIMVAYPVIPVTNRLAFKYDIIQSRNDNGLFIGGVRFDFKKPDCSSKFISAGSDITINRGCPATIGASLLPCTNYYWLSQNGQVISTSNILNVAPLGTTTYILKTVSSEGCISEDQITVTVTNDRCHGTKEILSVSPNPATDIVNVTYRIENTASAQIRVVKADNSYDRTYTLDPASNKITLDLSQFPHGAYSIVLIADGAVSDSKNLVILK